MRTDIELAAVAVIDNGLFVVIVVFHKAEKCIDAASPRQIAEVGVAGQTKELIIPEQHVVAAIDENRDRQPRENGCVDLAVAGFAEAFWDRCRARRMIFLRRPTV